MNLKILINLIAVISVIAVPQPPLWPQKFSYKFEESLQGRSNLFSVADQGSYIYDYAANTQLVSRNSDDDELCKTNGMQIFQSNPCSNYVVDGNRFLYYPESDECCFCCSQKNGCGVLTPDWAINATFVNDNETISGIPVFKWLIMGSGPNYLYETQEENPLERQTLRIVNGGIFGTQTLNFNLTTRELDFQPITLPSKCDIKHTCSIASLCTYFRTF